MVRYITEADVSPQEEFDSVRKELPNDVAAINYINPSFARKNEAYWGRRRSEMKVSCGVWFGFSQLVVHKGNRV